MVEIIILATVISIVVHLFEPTGRSDGDIDW